jgi:hypothetical protein
MKIEKFTQTLNFNSSLKLIIYGMLGPIGQLLMRIIDLKGSFDKIAYLLIPIFWIPPFSFIPIYKASLGDIKKNQESSILNRIVLGLIIFAISYLMLIGFQQYKMKKLRSMANFEEYIPDEYDSNEYY